MVRDRSSDDRRLPPGGVLMERAVHVNLLWCAPGRVGGSEEYLVRQLVGLPESASCAVHLGRSLAAARPELARHDLVVYRANVDRRSIRIPVEHSTLAWATRGAALAHHGGGTLPLIRPPVPTLLTIHDLQYRRFPQYFSRSRLAYLQSMVPRSARAATMIATPTAHVADDVAHAFGVDRDRIVVVPHGVPTAEVSSEEVRSIRERFMGGSAGRLMVYPAITHPHKGHQLLLDVMARWPHGDDRLVLIGGDGAAEREVRDAIASLGLTDRVIRAGRLPAHERDVLMAAADLMVFPSEEEGFGAPVIEAMAAGTAVVCSRIGALTEVVGDAGVIAERTIDAFTSGMEQALSNLDVWVDRGRHRAEAFSLAASGRALADAYRMAMDRGQGL